MAFDNPNSQDMRAIAAKMSRRSHSTHKPGYGPDLGSPVNDGQVGAGHGPMGSQKTPNHHPLPQPKQGNGGQRII